MDSAGTFSANGKNCGYGRTCSPAYPVRGICPEGWHLPDTTEWNSLFSSVGGKSIAGTILKSTSGWRAGGNGTGDYGFAALPAGYYSYDNFYFEGDYANFWCAAEGDGNYCGIFLDYDKEDAYLSNGDKDTGFSVRCLQD